MLHQKRNSLIRNILSNTIYIIINIPHFSFLWELYEMEFIRMPVSITHKLIAITQILCIGGHMFYTSQPLIKIKFYRSISITQEKNFFDQAC